MHRVSIIGAMVIDMNKAQVAVMVGHAQRLSLLDPGAAPREHLQDAADDLVQSAWLREA